MKCINNLPYPEIKVERPNIDYAYLLLQDYAGSVSETTAILTYSYQHFLDINENFSQVIKTIAITEMRHLDILGELICKLGFNPVYKTLQSDSNDMLAWNSDFVNYETNLEKLLKYNIKSETDAINNYLEHIKMIDDVYIKRILERIIEDEKIHIKCFNDLLDEYNKSNSNC